MNLNAKSKKSDSDSYNRPFTVLLNKIFYKSTNNILIQLIRYFFVGGTAFIVDFGLLASLTEFAMMPYQLSACIGFLGGLTVNYFLSIIWVFGSKADTPNSRLAEFFIFALIGIIGLGLNALILWVFTELLMFHYLASKIISAIIVFAWNFLARRSFINEFNILKWKEKLSRNK